MAGSYNDSVAKTVRQGAVGIVATRWTALQADSTLGNLTPRRHLRIQLKSNPGGAMAIAYAPKNSDGTFTTPTDSVKLVTIMPGNTTWIEPVSDVVTVYGRLVKKKALRSIPLGQS